MDMRQMTPMGRDIEKGSFAIIDEEVQEHQWGTEEWQVVRRIIHSTADFEFNHLARIHREAIDAGVKALQSGCNIITDVDMIRIGLSQSRLQQYGCRSHCFISDEDVIASAKKVNSTRATAAMKKAHSRGLLDGSIIVVGNAPTALLEVLKMVENNLIHPALIIGVPVGFVSAEESKDQTEQGKTPYIITKGRKGGSTIGVAIVHALFYIASDRESL